MSILSPIKVGLKENHPHILARGRPLGQKQTVFLRQKLKKLKEGGIVKQAKNPTCGSAAFVVAKMDQKRIEW